MSKIQFPKKFRKHKYGKIHIMFLRDYLIRGGADLIEVPENDKVFSFYKDIDHFLISITVDGRQVIINCSDHHYLTYQDEFEGIPIFKFHYYRDFHKDMPNVFPIGPMMIYNEKPEKNMSNYFIIRREYNYTPGDIVLNKQKSYGKSVERRNNVKSVLHSESTDLNGRSKQVEFWQQHENCLAAVCVPGAHNDMLDRGQYELMGLGVCTISPFIKTVMPWDQDLVPDKHYIRCADDYSDLKEKIEWARENKDRCQTIGDNAGAFFTNYCRPAMYVEWIETRTRTFYE